MEVLNTIANRALALSPANWCQAFFILTAAFIACLHILPDNMRKALMDYGARRPQDGVGRGRAEGNGKAGKQRRLSGFLDRVTSYGQVPHSWFLHFYIVSVSWSVFWALQYVRQGSIMQTVARLQRHTVVQNSSVELGRVYVAWLLMAAQGTRRLYESLIVTKPGSSPMWFVHWIMGWAFYTAMGMSVWVEGSDAVLQPWRSFKVQQLLTPRILLGVVVFFFAWAKQNQCHRYLASLQKYTLPSEGWFQYIICPHYTSECLLYVALAFIAAPPGSLFNRTVLCGVIFVAVNLGATAHGTKQWYASKFGPNQVRRRWKMIPFVF